MVSTMGIAQLWNINKQNLVSRNGYPLKCSFLVTGTLLVIAYQIIWARFSAEQLSEKNWSYVKTNLTRTSGDSGRDELNHVHTRAI